MGARFVLVLLTALLAPAVHAQPTSLAQSLDFVWSGALQPTSVRVVAGVYGADSVRIALTTDTSFDEPDYTAYQPVNEESQTVAFSIGGLEPEATYRYAVEVGGVLDTLRAGSFRTPAEGPFSYSVVLGGCAITGSDRPVFDVIRRQEPLFFLAVGDFHYEDIDDDDPEVYRQAYREVLDSGPQAALYRSTPLAYMWDDHDYGPNNSDRFAPGRSAARRAYQQMIPHYPLVAGSG